MQIASRCAMNAYLTRKAAAISFRQYFFFQTLTFLHVHYTKIVKPINAINKKYLTFGFTKHLVCASSVESNGTWFGFSANTCVLCVEIELRKKVILRHFCAIQTSIDLLIYKYICPYIQALNDSIFTLRDMIYCILSSFTYFCFQYFKLSRK